MDTSTNSTPLTSYDNRPITRKTTAGYAKENGETVAYREALDVKFKRPTQYAWTYQEPGMITSDYKGKAEALAAKRKEIEQAPLVENGDWLEIDGQLYTAKVLGDYSDPVKLTKHTAPAAFVLGMVADISETKLEALTHEQLKNLVRDMRQEAKKFVS